MESKYIDKLFEIAQMNQENNPNVNIKDLFRSTLSSIMYIDNIDNVRIEKVLSRLRNVERCSQHNYIKMFYCRKCASIKLSGNEMLK